MWTWSLSTSGWRAQAFAAAGFAVNRYRLISGRALDVLPRLNDAGYDLVFCDADKQEYPDYLTAALRLLRPGGIAVFDNALWGGRVPDPSYQDEDTDGDQGSVRTLRDPTSNSFRCSFPWEMAYWPG